MAQVLVSPSAADSAANVAARALLNGASPRPAPPPALSAPVPSIPRRPMTDEEHAALVKAQRAAKAGVRPPRRSHSASEFDIEQQMPNHPPQPRYLYTPVLAPTQASPISPLTPLTPGLPAVMELASPSTPTTPSTNTSLPPQPPMQVRTARPKPKKPPRRAFSLMEYEPVVHTHRPSNRVSLLDLPTDIHFAIFDFLDPIDSVCFGLSSRVFYPIHRRLHGRVSLASRRNGPNTLDGPNPARPPPRSPGLVDREAIRLDGQVYCRKCGTSRCELHSHLREWMGPDREYCSVSRKFGKKAPAGARESCYKRSPKNPSACGRHTPRMRASAPVSPKLQAVQMA
ncbi:hypothetical protein TD95_001886 [Thielaviopsis punctulata]|uniref:F-box domain-containing protein n=1 Tax=Thielaviopsis punctulata TaxID=72032 RepID=A0A0F4ZFH3_9PEZI|nr:hypothetical protein TD95_001886 [Thielaviopsis punctulata]